MPLSLQLLHLSILLWNLKGFREGGMDRTEKRKDFFPLLGRPGCRDLWIRTWFAFALIIYFLILLITHITIYTKKLLLWRFYPLKSLRPPIPHRYNCTKVFTLFRFFQQMLLKVGPLPWKYGQTYKTQTYLLIPNLDLYYANTWEEEVHGRKTVHVLSLKCGLQELSPSVHSPRGYLWYR